MLVLISLDDDFKVLYLLIQLSELLGKFEILGLFILL